MYMMINISDGNSSMLNLYHGEELPIYGFYFQLYILPSWELFAFRTEILFLDLCRYSFTVYITLLYRSISGSCITHFHPQLPNPVTTSNLS